MSFSSTGVEPASSRGSPRTDLPHLDQMECDHATSNINVGDHTDHYMPDLLPSDGMVSYLAYFSLFSHSLHQEKLLDQRDAMQRYLALLQETAAAEAEVARLTAIVNESDFNYSDLGMDYASGLGLERYELGSQAYSPYVGIYETHPSLDAEFDDLPSLLEPLEAPDVMDVVSTLPEASNDKGKGREVENEAETENRDGRARDPARRAKEKGKGKARASPYPDPRDRLLHLRSSLGMPLLPLFPGYLTNIGGCTDDAMGDLTEFRTSPLLLPDNHFAGDPSRCGVPHHDDD
jgi:hypothetical protein